MRVRAGVTESSGADTADAEMLARLEDELSRAVAAQIEAAAEASKALDADFLELWRVLPEVKDEGVLASLRTLVQTESVLERSYDIYGSAHGRRRESMDERTDGISRRQLSILLFVSALAAHPAGAGHGGAERRERGLALGASGSRSAAARGAPARAADAKARPRRGAGGVLLRVFGRFGGTAAVLLYTAWTVFYAGFVLRAGADRFVTAVYPGSRPWLFMAVMAALCVPACLGRLKTLGRCAEIALPLLALVFLFAFLFCLPGLDAANLAPISSDSLADAARGAPWLLSTMSVLLLLAFLSDRTEPGPLAAPFNRAFLALGLLAALLCVTVVATFGAKLTAEMYYPFFVMIRCIRIFRLLERVEALVVAQWVTTDFLLLGALLQAATGELTLCFPKLGARRGAVALTCLALALLSGALCAPTAFFPAGAVAHARAHCQRLRRRGARAGVRRRADTKENLNVPAGKPSVFCLRQNPPPLSGALAAEG